MMTTLVISSLIWNLQVSQNYEIDQQKIGLANNRLRAHIHAGELAGAVGLVMLDGKIVAHDAFGWSDLEQKQLMKKDTLFQVMSMTKPVTATAAMICVERGLLSLDDPVEKYLPQFKGVQVKGKDGVLRVPLSKPTIRNLMTHTSGLSSDDPGGISDEEKWQMSLSEYAKLLGSEPLQSDPGTNVRYSGVGFSTLAAIVETVTGQKFDDFVTDEILKPLEMKETNFFLPVKLRSRLSQVYTKDKGALVPFGHDRYRIGAKFANGAGGLYATAADMGRFIDSFRVGASKTVLSPNSIQLMTKINTGDLPSDGNDARGYGLSWSIIRSASGQGTLRNLGSFGHTGAFGSEFWHDQSTGLTVVFMAQTFLVPEEARRQYSTMVNSSLKERRTGIFD